MNENRTNSHKDLDVWKKSLRLVTDIAVSIPTNIAKTPVSEG